MHRLLPQLCNEHGLTRNQVVAIASNHGGRQALETVRRLLPELCKTHGLAVEQVVAIASNLGGKQALESILAQLSRRDPALAALSNQRLVALACLGGRSALEAVIKGLPHAPMLLRKASQHAPEAPSHRVADADADAAQIVQVLNFFQCHCRPAHAFDEAMRQFGMSRSGLLQLFRRVGVTELEACSGTLPPAARRWQRIEQALGGPLASAPAPHQEFQHAFADSLNHEQDTPSPVDEAGQALALSRKRTRSDGSVSLSPQQPDQALVPEQSGELRAHLPDDWGVKRPRTKISGGLPDPGTPTGADLAASSSVFLGQDAASFAGPEEDFPTFNDNEMEWLMGLFS